MPVRRRKGDSRRARFLVAIQERLARVADVDVDGKKHAVAGIGRDGECLGQAHRQAANADLAHLVGAHLLLGHSLEGFRVRPVAAQPELEEAITAQRAGLDGAAHGAPCPHREPNSISPVSACASKWTIETRPAPSTSATPEGSANAMAWSPPKISGIAPVAVMLATAARRSLSDLAASPENSSTSPAS